MSLSITNTFHNLRKVSYLTLNNNNGENDKTHSNYILPKIYLFLLVLLILISTFKNSIITLLETYYFSKKLMIEKVDDKFIDNIINSKTIRDYFFENYLNEIKDFSREENIKLSDYKSFFLKLINSRPEIKDVINQTLLKKHTILTSILITVIQMSIIVVLSVLTNHLLSLYIIYDPSLRNMLVVSSSFIFMIILTVEGLSLISYFDMKNMMELNIGKKN